ncbi:hypothetical protein AAGF08_14705 [Algoriphagus sp. SE2]|uniref:hypothetical protein n=1 Tax=Algoriphagus sp. SE2 TaxID=3141536 RepID=UPI0031CD297B
MNKLLRIVITLLAFLGAFYFSNWILVILVSVTFGIETFPTWINILQSIISFGLALFLAKTVWSKNTFSKNSSHSLGKYVLTGMISLGIIGFLIGFIGPLIFMPDANQGPLLGIFVTGPGGLVLGAVGGLIFGIIKNHKLKKAAKNESGSFE